MKKRKIKAFVSVFLTCAALYGVSAFCADAQTASAAETDVSTVSVADSGMLPLVQTPADTFSITGGTSVPNISKGQCVTVRGIIHSGYSNITSLTVGVFDEAGNFITGKTVSPYTDTYNLGRLDNDVSFNLLSAGSYYYRIVASNASCYDYVVVNQRFTVTGSGSQSTDTLSITGGTNISNISRGKGVVVKGIVHSASSNITSLTVGIYNTSGSLVTGRTVSPYAASYDLNRLDNDVQFDRLPAGNYDYKVIASNASHTNYVVVSHNFTVSDSSSQNTDTLSITGGTSVPDIAKGKGVVIQGTVRSASSNITDLTVGIYDTSGNPVMGKTVYPNTIAYNVNRLDDCIAFDQLNAGTYYYKVIASNASRTNEVLVSQKFTVSDGASQGADAISVTGGTQVPGNISKGKGVIVQGTIRSASSNITSLTVGVYNTAGSLVTGKTVAPYATSYNLNRLDDYVAFSALSAGTYDYKIIASNASRTNEVIVSQRFTVSDGASQEADTISITGGTNVPDITKGKGVVVQGTVRSASSNITSLTVGVYNTAGSLVTGKTVAPYTTAYNLNRLDDDVAFSALSAGTYNYKVIVSNASRTNEVLVNQKFTVSDGASQSSDFISLTGGTSVPNISKGKGVVVQGTVRSASSNITSLTVGVYDTTGSLMTGKTVSPYATSYNLNRLDDFISFNLLPAGTYDYKVIASNASCRDYVLSNQRFTVSDSGTSNGNTSVFSISGGTHVPDITRGKGVSVFGTVKSATSNITSLTVGVYDTAGNLVTGKTVSPYTTIYQLSQLDDDVKFNLLSSGTYYYRVIVSNADSSNVAVVNQKFTVSD
ncbi:MAG: hypothetical protein ACI4JQ_02495 [Ruminococcus sp.]